MSQIPALREKGQAAALGPWVWSDEEIVPGPEFASDEDIYVRVLRSPGRMVLAHATYWRIREQEATFIALARNLWEPLLDVVEAAQKQVGCEGDREWYAERVGRRMYPIQDALAALEAQARTALQEPEEGK